MKINTVSSLARSDDADLRALGLKRLLHTHPVDDAGQNVLREAIPSLQFDELLELLCRHNVLGRPGQIVERLIALFPTQEMDQLNYFWFLNLTSTLAKTLDEDAYADFVEKVLPLVFAPRFKRELAQRLRGCALFNDIVTHDGARDEGSICMVPGSLAASLIEIRRDTHACHKHLEQLITEASRAELLRLEGVLCQTSHAALTRQAQQRLLDGFELKAGFDEDPEWEVNAGHLAFVTRWITTEATDRPQRLQWFADRVATLEKAGSWFTVMGYDKLFPAALIREITLLLIERREPPSWAGALLLERLASREVTAWDDVFRWWDRLDSLSRASSYATFKEIMTKAPLPASAPAEFDENFLRCARDLIAFECAQIRTWQQIVAPRSSTKRGDEAAPRDLDRLVHTHPMIHRHTKHLRPLLTVETAVERLLEMELTAARAGAIVGLLENHPRLRGHPRMSAAVAMAGALEAQEPPEGEVADRHDVDHASRDRRLEGPAADHRPQDHVRSAILAEVDEAPSSADRFDVPRAGVTSPCIEDFLDDTFKSTLRAHVVDAPLHVVLACLRTNPDTVDALLVREAAQRHLDAGHRWDRLDLIPPLRPFVELRLHRTNDDEELLALLDWLEKEGLPPAAKLDAVIAELGRRPPTSMPDQIGKLLPTRSSWEKNGPRLLRALLRWNDWGMIHRAWFGLYEAVRGRPTAPGGTKPRSEAEIDALLAAAHLAFATVLLEMASAAAEARDEARFLTLLTAVLKLDPPPTIVPMLRRLTRWPDLSIRAQEWVAQGTMLFKSAAGRTASFDALAEATNVMLAAGAAALPDPSA